MSEEQKPQNSPAQQAAPTAATPAPATSTKGSFVTLFRNLPPVFAFWAGVISTAAILFTIGFLILVVLMLKGVDLSVAKTASTNSNSSAVAANTNSAAKAVKIDMSTIQADHYRGSGDITILEFTDLECPYCKQFHNTMTQVMQKYDGKVRWAFKNFPLNIHPKAQKEGEAAQCASAQGKFWEYIDKVFERTPSNNKMEDAEIYKIADELGLDRTKFDGCLTNGESTSIITTDANQAQALGATGTPFVLVLDKTGNVIATIPGALPLTDTTNTGKASMSSVLDQILK